jgi:RsiW-degrading membrane proteinase PrsW (M82 family)
MAVVASVVVCAVFLGWMVYRYDLYEKEPWYLLLLAAGLGCGFSWVVSFVQDYSNALLGFDQLGDSHTIGQAAVAASHEEVTHLLVVIVIAVLFRRHFNDPLDGLIYGAFAGLGMGLVESLYLLKLMAGHARFTPDVGIVGREAVRLVLHALMGGISGFGVGLFVERSRIRHWLLAVLAFLALATVLHFLWDYVCGIQAAEGELDARAESYLRIASVVLMLMNISVFALLVVVGSRMSRARIAPDSAKRLSRWTLFH